MSNHCLCGKAKSFDQCCGKYLMGRANPKTPEQLMRSRYCAYALGGYGQYLFDTWHPSMRQQLNIDDLSKRLHEWTKLEVMNKTQKGNEATVEFKAFYIDKTNRSKVMHEDSYFQRVSGLWLYVGENVQSKNAP